LRQISALVLPFCDEKYFFTELISSSVLSHMADMLHGMSITDCCYAGTLDESQQCMPALQGENTQAAAKAFFAQAKGELVLLLLLPTPCLSPASLSALLEQAGKSPAILRSGKTMIAIAGEKDAVAKLFADGSPLDDLPTVEAQPVESTAVINAETAYIVQETLRRRINLRHLRAGVMLIDPSTTHISPEAKIEPGVCILPNCQIYGKTVIGAGSRIGPNTLLQDAVLGKGVRVNASQIYESSVGDETTVGPFAYIRPGCAVADHVKIGDFVELKKSNIGSGTKISHLTYIGDTDLGKKINIGCGVVTVNYDGKKKYRTKVGDNSFIGCNVNLVSPVNIGDGAYVAAGSTVTDDVEADALVVARSRQTVKPGWAKQRREDGKL